MNQHTNVNRLDPDAFLNVRSVWVVGYLVGQDLGVAEGVDKSSATRSRRTYDADKMFNFLHHRESDVHTNNHEGELDTLLDLVAPASASERHFE